MDRESRIRKILFDLADVATTAADGVSDAMQTASQVVGEKYDVLRLNVELTRLQSEQDKIFAGIGHTMYMIQTGEITPEADEETGDFNAQQTIDRLLLLADQKQQEIDAALEKLHGIDGTGYCEKCGHDSAPGAAYCSTCGTKLHNE